MPVYALGADAPQLPPKGQYWIAPTASVIGRVVLKKDASVWYGVVMRGDNPDPLVLGEGSNIQDNSVVHTNKGDPLIIGDNVTVGHSVILHSCIVGDGSLIGMGATLLSRCVIGKNCLVGAGALVTEGKVFPDNSLIVGSPAKVVRTLTEEEIARFQKGASGYVLNWKRHAAEIREIEA
jgi:carbonic anhydrase/acetyltransferase-like protein (isoleucine patch superfamily)